MNNNPTIDGVSRDLRLLLNASVNGTEQEQGRARNELRALLDAPLETVNGHHPACRAVDDYKPGECSHSCAPAVERQEPVTMKRQYLSVPGLWIECADDDPEVITFYKQTPEVDALQSTIARLEARITQLESEAEFAAATYQAARDRIAELESGRGEPVAVMYADGSVLTKAECGTAFEICCKVETPLFTASPAPVAVVPDGWKLVPIEPTELMIRRGDQNYSWSVAKIYKAMIEDAPACLDATAALNRVKS